MAAKAGVMGSSFGGSFFDGVGLGMTARPHPTVFSPWIGGLGISRKGGWCGLWFGTWAHLV